MKLPDIQYSTPTEGLGRYGSRAPAIIEKTGGVLGSSIKEAGRINAAAIRQSSDYVGRSIASAAKTVAQGQLKAAEWSNATTLRNTMENNRIDAANEIRMSNALVGAATSLMQTGLQTYVTYQDEKSKQQKFEATQLIHQDMMTQQRSWMGSPTVDATGLPDSYTGERANADGTPIQVPMSQALPEMYGAAANASIENHAARIADPQERENFITSMKMKVDERVYELSENALKVQRKESEDMQGVTIETHIENRDFDSARLALETSMFKGTSAGVEYNNQIDTAEEIDLVTDVSLSGSRNEVQAMRAALTDPEYKGKLTPKNLVTAINRLDGRLKDIADQGVNLLAAERSVVTEKVEHALDVSETGVFMNIGSLDILIAEGTKYGVSQSKIEELKQVKRFQPWINEFNKAPGLQRNNMLLALEKLSFEAEAAGDYGPRLFHQRMVKRSDALAKEAISDPLGLAARNNNIAPLSSFDPTNPDMWADRKKKGYAAAAAYNVPTKFMTDTEAEIMTNEFNGYSDEQKIRYMGFIRQTMGKDAPQVFDQLGLKNPSISVMGTVGGRISTEALSGARIRQDMPQMVPPKTEVQMTLVDVLGNAYQTSGQHRTALETMMVDVYLARKQQMGDFDPSLNTKLMKQVAKDMPLMDWGGNKYISPEGVDSAGFKEWLHRVHPLSVIGGQVPGMSDEEVMDDIIRKEIVLHQTSRDEWALIEKGTNQKIAKRDGQPFILKYDNSLPERTEGAYRNIFERLAIEPTKQDYKDLEHTEDGRLKIW